jgi:hypothetical protein
VDHPELVASQSAVARAIAERELCWEKNAEVLLDWIPKQRILGDRDGADLKALTHRALRYDRCHCPSPLQHALLSAKMMYDHWKRRFAYR